VLPWSQFLYAEGNDEHIRLAFSTHDILIAGQGLGSLHEDLCRQRLSMLREPIRAERFSVDPGPGISSISVKKID
jgi:hypothetical protein